jgi:hypothetical protein
MVTAIRRRRVPWIPKSTADSSSRVRPKLIRRATLAGQVAAFSLSVKAPFISMTSPAEIYQYRKALLDLARNGESTSLLC